MKARQVTESFACRMNHVGGTTGVQLRIVQIGEILGDGILHVAATANPAGIGSRQQRREAKAGVPARQLFEVGAQIMIGAHSPAPVQMHCTRAVAGEAVLEQRLQRREPRAGAHQNHGSPAPAPIDLSERPFE